MTLDAQQYQTFGQILEENKALKLKLKKLEPIKHENEMLKMIINSNTKTLRDEFAMSIITGYVSRCNSDGKANSLTEEDIEYAFGLADKAMKARKVKS